MLIRSGHLFIIIAHVQRVVRREWSRLRANHKCSPDLGSNCGSVCGRTHENSPHGQVTPDFGRARSLRSLMSQPESLDTPPTHPAPAPFAASATPPDAALINDPTKKCNIDLKDSAGRGWIRRGCTFACCSLVPEDEAESAGFLGYNQMVLNAAGFAIPIEQQGPQDDRERFGSEWSYNEYMHVTNEGFDSGISEAPESSSHGSPPPKYSEPSPSKRSEPHSRASSLDPPTAGPDTRKRLGMEEPEGGWEAYYADKKLSESEKKKPACGAGSSRLISDDAPVSPLAKQPKFDDE